VENSAIEVAIVGGGINSAVGRAHISALRMDGKFKITSACMSRNPTINAESQEQYGLNDSVFYDSVKQLAENAEFDALVILTPTPNHAATIELFSERKTRIISEKSLAVSYEETEHVYTQITKTSSELYVTLNYSGYPMIRELRQKLINGEFGEVLELSIEMPQETFLRTSKIQEWRTRDYSIPTLCLDLSVHTYHLASFLLGQELVFLSGTNYSHRLIGTLVDRSYCQLETSNQLTQVYLRTSKIVLGNRNGLTVKLIGTQKSALWIQEEPDRMHIASRDGTREIVDRGSPLELANEARYQRFKAGHPTGFVESLANLYHDISASIHFPGDENPFTAGIKEAISFARSFDIHSQNWTLKDTKLSIQNE
jgi:predicted dehydrogenase